MNYCQVDLLSIKADQFGRRYVYASSRHTQETPFVFDKYYALPEEFLIPFRTSFYLNEDAVKLQQLCSMVGGGEAVAVTDDGRPPEVVIKTGTITKAPVTLPADGGPLIPWRTFREVSPVQSRFLLRMKGVKDGLPHIAFFESDQHWRLDTINAIASWLGSKHSRRADRSLTSFPAEERAAGRTCGPLLRQLRGSRAECQLRRPARHLAAFVS